MHIIICKKLEAKNEMEKIRHTVGGEEDNRQEGQSSGRTIVRKDNRQEGQFN